MISLLLLLLLFFMLLLFVVSAPNSKQGFEAVVIYKMVDLEWDNYFRNRLESFRNNKRMFLETNKLNVPYVYVSAKDYKNIISTSPHEMKRNGRSIKVILEVEKLLLGGYGNAKVISFEEIDAVPTLIK